MMRPTLPKLNSTSAFVFLISAIIFIEIIVMSPQLLEKDNVDVLDPNADIDLINSNQNKNTIEQKMMGAHLVENSDNHKGWELFATEAILKGDGTWFLKKVKVQFFTENKARYTVTGDVGEMDSRSKDMVIRGHTTTTSSNGYSFKTDTIRYIAKQNLMTSVDKVLMTGPEDNSGSGFKLVGEKLLVDINKNKMSILDKVVANKEINDKDFKLRSTRADFSNTNQEASFIGNVQMKLGTIDVKSPMALFQYSATKKRLEKIILNDKVEFIEQDKKGFCTELEFDLLDNRMTMRGQPKVLQGEDEIKGHEIVFIDGGKKVKINKEKK